MASSTARTGGCDVFADLYHNQPLASVWNNPNHLGTGVAATECEQGETLRVRTNDHTCHDMLSDTENDRWNWFSVVLIAMT